MYQAVTDKNLRTVRHSMKTEVLTNSAEETFLYARGIGEKARIGDVFALYGGLGAGKTVFAKGFADGMGIGDEITSPTFTLLNIHENNTPLYHFDLYRIRSSDELDLLCFEEYWNNSGVSVIEWADRAAGRLPEHTVSITMEHVNEEKRRITVEYPDH